MSSPEILQVIIQIREAMERFVKELERIVKVPPPVPKPKIEVKPRPPIVVPVREVPTEAPVEIVVPMVIPRALLPRPFRELTVEEVEKVLRTVIRAELEAALKWIYAIYPDYLYFTGTVTKDEPFEVNVVDELGRIGLRGYVINEHGTDTFYIRLNRGDRIDVKAGEAYPIAFRLVEIITIETDSTASLPYRLEIR